MAPLRKLLLFVAYLTLTVEGLARPGLGDEVAKHINAKKIPDKKPQAPPSPPQPKSQSGPQQGGKSSKSSKKGDGSKSKNPASGSGSKGKPGKSGGSGGSPGGKSAGKHESKHGGGKKDSKTAHKSVKAHAASNGKQHKNPKHKSGGAGAKAPSTGIWDANFGPYFADPCLIKDGAYWYAFSTMSCTSNMEIARSKTRAPGSWHSIGGGNHLPGANTVWGPDIRKEGSEYILMYSDSSSLLTATSSSVGGPFSNIQPLISGGDTKFIDGAFFQDTDGSLHVVYKHSKYDKATKKHIWTKLEIRKLDRSGRTTSGKARVLQTATKNDGDHNIEAPYLIHKNGWYYLTFSTHEYAGPAYNTEYVSAKSLGQLEHAKRNTLLSSSTTAGGHTLNGPGGLSFAAGGGDEVVFHNRQDPYPPNAGNCAKGQNGLHRKLWSGVVTFNGRKLSIAT